MKSKIKFDLNGQNEAVVSAQIVFGSEDVRDKVARTFHEGLSYDSNLAYVQIHPDTTIYGLINRGGKEVDGEMNGRNIQIKTFKGDFPSSRELVKLLCVEQLESLLKAIPLELKGRKNSPQVRVN